MNISDLKTERTMLDGEVKARVHVIINYVKDLPNIDPHIKKKMDEVINLNKKIDSINERIIKGDFQV